MSRHLIAPEWVTSDYSFPADVKVTHCDDLTTLSNEVLNSADFIVIPYLQDSDEIEATLKRLTNPCILQSLTAGYNHITPFLASGITLCNAVGVHDDSTSELAVLLTLSMLRELPRLVHGHEKQIWDQFFSKSLADKKVLLIGYGGVGKATEQRLLGFKCEVIPVATTARDHVRAISELPNLIPSADVIILTVPLNESTYHLVNQQFIDQMKTDSLLVNVARGAVVDTEALLAALQAKKIFAALDVTDPEPLPEGHPLWQLPNCFVTPHLGGEADVFAPRAQAMVSSQLDLWLTGQPINNVVSS